MLLVFTSYYSIVMHLHIIWTVNLSFDYKLRIMAYITSRFLTFFLTLMAFSLFTRGRPYPSSPLVPVYGHILGNTHARNVILDLLMPCLIGSSSLSGSCYCQVHHSAGDVFASLLWTYPNQRRRPSRITSSVDETCSMRRPLLHV